MFYNITKKHLKEDLFFSFSIRNYNIFITLKWKLMKMILEMISWKE